jgi:hypothetical protein
MSHLFDEKREPNHDSTRVAWHSSRGRTHLFTERFTMLSIKFTKKERSPEQRIDRVTIGPESVAFAWRHDGQDHVLDLPKPYVQTIITRIKKGVKESITCNRSSSTGRPVVAWIDGDSVQLDYAENGASETACLSVKSLHVLKAFLAEK